MFYSVSCDHPETIKTRDDCDCDIILNFSSKTAENDRVTVLHSLQSQLSLVFIVSVCPSMVLNIDSWHRKVAPFHQLVYPERILVAEGGDGVSSLRV